MRRPKRAQGSEMRLNTVEGIQFGDVEQFVRSDRGQDVVQTFGDHRFTAAGTSLQEQVMHAAGADKSRTFGILLPFDVKKVQWIMFLKIVGLFMDVIMRMVYLC